MAMTPVEMELLISNTSVKYVKNLGLISSIFGIYLKEIISIDWKYVKTVFIAALQW